MEKWLRGHLLCTGVLEPRVFDHGLRMVDTKQGATSREEVDVDNATTRVALGGHARAASLVAAGVVHTGSFSLECRWRALVPGRSDLHQAVPDLTIATKATRLVALVRHGTCWA